MMQSMKLLLVTLILLSSFINVQAEPNTQQGATNLPIEKLDNNQYQVGNILIDKNKNVFTLPGKVIRNLPPIEFIAVTKNGDRAYESLLEMDVNAYEFNLACILIGLDEKNGKSSPNHFSQEEVQGDKVEANLIWKKKDKTLIVAIADLLQSKKKPLITSDWVYTASSFSHDGKFMADLDGTLIGFVHSINTIIEHRIGLSLGDYGGIAVTNNLPPIGTEIILKISNPKK